MKPSGPLVAVAYPDRIPPVSFSDRDRFWARVRRATQRQALVGAGSGATEGWGRVVAPEQGDARATLSSLDIGGFAAKGKIAGTPATSFRTGDLTKVRWSRPFRMHYAYMDIPIVALPQGASEEAFLKTVAAAVGARFVKGSAFELKLDPSALRTRLLATTERWRQLKLRDRSVRDATASRYAMLRECLAQLTDAELVRTFASPRSVCNLERVTPALERSIRTYIQELKDISRLSTARPNVKANLDLLQQASSMRPMLISIGGNLGVTVYFPRRGGGSVGIS